jgi:hypothetical protein
MQPRVKYLLIGLLAIVLFWQVGGWAWSTLAEPFQSSSDRLESLKKSVSTKQQSTLMLIKSTKMLKDWKSSSLPPDPGKSKQPTAVNAQRLYLEWITDLAELCGFEDVKVHAGMTTLKAKVYI